MRDQSKQPIRTWIARVFTTVEDVVYVGLGLLLAIAAIVLLVGGFVAFAQNVAANTLGANIIALLDRILLILLVVELLYTVQVSFREHTIVPEPFLIVGIIAAIRRVLVITAEFGHVPQPADAVFQRFLWELSILTVLVFVLVVSLLLLRKRPGQISAERA
jgi:uncharacterized membrane protein (DUF373 family)